MKRLTLTTIGTLAAVLAFSTGCSESKKISELKTQLKEVEEAFDRASTEFQKASVELAVTQEKLAVKQKDWVATSSALYQHQLQLTAKDKIISELKAELSAALEHPPQ